MLEHVALGQSRFMTPGVAPDPRGVLLGRYGVLRFPTLEGVVSWFRLYSSESSLDELLPGMGIYRVRTPLQSRELIVRIPAASSYALDRASRCAKLVGGSTFTGTTKHFVQYRDDVSPYGYDATEITALPQGAEMMLHGEDFAQSYVRDGELAFEKLLYRLSLRRIPGGDRLRSDERQELLLAVAGGLGDGVIRYLWRNQVDAEVALIRPGDGSSAAAGGNTGFGASGGAFGELGGRKRYLVIRARELPERILELFVATPGIDVFRTAAANVAVQVGFKHIIDLGACSSVFDAEKFYLFWGKGDRVDVVNGPVEMSGIEHLTRVDIDLHAPREHVTSSAEVTEPADIIGVNIRLAPSLTPPTRVIATLIPLAQAAWLKRLVYLVPKTALRGHRVAVTDHGILLVATEEIDIIPLGQLLSELAPGLLVPIGMDLVPRVAPSVLARSLGHGAGVLTVFPHGVSADAQSMPFQVRDADLVPLERRAIARLEVARGEAMDESLVVVGDPTVTNRDVGRFALWGFKVPREDI